MASILFILLKINTACEISAVSWILALPVTLYNTSLELGDWQEINIMPLNQHQSIEVDDCCIPKHH
eukprot:scaffold21574_cov158-Skeletonema_dohrnii-CCMP3373.AAC.3